MAFYGEMEKAISRKDEFIHFYGQFYFMNHDCYLYSNRGHSPFIEEQIDRILRDGIRTPSNVSGIIAWKSGKIKHAESERVRDWRFAKGWENCLDSCGAALYGKAIDFCELAKFICANRERLEKEAKGDRAEAQAVLNEIREHSPEYLGTGNMIALLFFLSGGKYPLYDRAVQIALAAYELDIKPRGPMAEAKGAVPEINSRAKFAALLDEGGAYARYMDSLEDIFGPEYRENRDIDRALQVYGHYMAAAEKLHVR